MVEGKYTIFSEGILGFVPESSSIINVKIYTNLRYSRILIKLSDVRTVMITK